MSEIVRIALRRPYTFVVLALLLLLIGPLAASRTPVDIFPEIRIPVIAVIWTYTGMSPDDMAKRVLLVSERAMTTTVNSIEHIEATSYNGIGLIRLYLQPGANIDLAISQIVAVNQTILRTLPPGIFLAYDGLEIDVPAA